MNTTEKNISTPEHDKSKARVRELVEAGAKKAGGYRQLAEILDVHPQLISNWKNGVKNPSAEAQAEIAMYAGIDPVITTYLAALEKATGKRLKLLQFGYQQWMKEREQFIQWKKTKINSVAL